MLYSRLPLARFNAKLPITHSDPWLAIGLCSVPQPQPLGLAACNYFCYGTDKVSAYTDVLIQRQRLVTRNQSAGFPPDPSTFCVVDSSLDTGVH